MLRKRRRCETQRSRCMALAKYTGDMKKAVQVVGAGGYGVGRRMLLLCIPLGLIVGIGQAQTGSSARLLERASSNPRLQLQEREHAASGSTFLAGSYRVWEDRVAMEGRTLELNLIVLPALSEEPAADPVFVLHGGPGAAATGFLHGMAKSWIRNRRDIVLIDQRGTGRSNPLQVPLPNGGSDPQLYLDPIFVTEYFQSALPALSKIADLTQYTTPIAMDDLNEVREALGYGVINLRGGSYGSRAGLVYMRRHPETVRTATLNGIMPIANRNPLYHAAAAQEALEVLAKECQSTARYRAVFPDLLEMVSEILQRLEESPVRVRVTDPGSGKAVQVTLSREAFAEALRVMMYNTRVNRQVPLLVMRAHAGDYTAFAQKGLETGRALRGMVCFGMLMCVTGSEDLPRIDPGEIEGLTRDTFLGDSRVRMQLAVGAIWPRGIVPEDYGDPVGVEVPTLLLSGTHDPVTPPHWGAEVARHLPRSLHLVFPGAHGVGGKCVASLEQDFLERGTVEGLDTSCLSRRRMPQLELPEGDD